MFFIIQFILCERGMSAARHCLFIYHTRDTTQNAIIRKAYRTAYILIFQRSKVNFSCLAPLKNYQPTNDDHTTHMHDGITLNNGIGSPPGDSIPWNVTINLPPPHLFLLLQYIMHITACKKEALRTPIMLRRSQGGLNYTAAIYYYVHHSGLSLCAFDDSIRLTSNGPYSERGLLFSLSRGRMDNMMQNANILSMYASHEDLCLICNACYMLQCKCKRSCSYSVLVALHIY